MAINVDLSETQNPDRVGEYVRVAPGAAHFLVLDAQENGGKNGEHVVKLEVLMHADPTQVGLVHVEHFPADAKMAWKLLSFSYAVKIADRELMKQQKEQGLDIVPIELKDAIGRQLFGTIKLSEKPKSNGAPGEMSQFHNLDKMYAIDDEAAKNFPRNQGMLAQALKTLPVKQPAGNSAATGQSATAPTQTQATANPFAALT